MHLLQICPLPHENNVHTHYTLFSNFISLSREMVALTKHINFWALYASNCITVEIE